MVNLRRFQALKLAQCCYREVTVPTSQMCKPRLCVWRSTVQSCFTPRHTNTAKLVTTARLDSTDFSIPVKSFQTFLQGPLGAAESIQRQQGPWIFGEEWVSLAAFLCAIFVQKQGRKSNRKNAVSGSPDNRMKGNSKSAAWKSGSPVLTGWVICRRPCHSSSPFPCLENGNIT